ncbi:MAG: hypothetical protein UHD09_05685, partial [Bifidobacterium sp.]|nr:hypothetical protein [Bifidobacterium sp.]
MNKPRKSYEIPDKNAPFVHDVVKERGGRVDRTDGDAQTGRSAGKIVPRYARNLTFFRDFSWGRTTAMPSS